MIDRITKKLIASRDSFLPPRFRGSKTTLVLELHEEWSRARRFASLSIVVLVASVFAGISHLLNGVTAAGIATLVTAMVLYGMLVALRRGVSPDALGAALVAAGSLLAVGIAVAAGRQGLSSLYWVGLAPVFALALSGPRFGRAMLAITLGLITVALWLIFHDIVPPYLQVKAEVGAHIVSVGGAVVAYYFLARTFEGELKTTIDELRQMNQQLVEARADADRASRAKGEFLAMMSHEIRTPLNGVLGMTSVMLGTELPPNVHDGLTTIKQSGDTLLGLINDVLDYSKMESGKLVLEDLPCDLRREVAWVRGLLSDAASSRGNTIVVQVDESVPPWLAGDPMRLRQVLMNLVSNAVKLTSRGRVDIVARASAGRLVLEVRDTGLGMSPQTCAALFQPFTQADASTTRRFGGTGLGLAIVRRIVEAMDGTVSVDSREGEGSTFRVDLPLRATEAPAIEAAPVAAPVAFRQLTVLVAEDNRVNQLVAQMMLQQVGHRVLLAENGQEALTVVATQPVDLVFLDCHMPVMDGYEATRRLRAEHAVKLPIIALTAAALPEETALCIEAGMDDVLLKPLRRQDLERVLARYV